jgi:hypothetical protein
MTMLSEEKRGNSTRSEATKDKEVNNIIKERRLYK